jgi:hypothetical protein
MHLKPISRDLRRELYGRRRRGKSTSPGKDRKRRSRSLDRRRQSNSRSRDVKKRRSRSKSKESRKRTGENRRSKSRERKHHRSEEKDKTKERDRPRDKNRDREREKRERRDNPVEVDGDTRESKMTEQERYAIQSEIDANMNEIFANQESNSLNNGAEESQEAAHVPEFVAKDEFSNQESNPMYQEEFAVTAPVVTENTDSSQNEEDGNFF